MGGGEPFQKYNLSAWVEVSLVKSATYLHGWR
jgi:hypothetical protein